MYVYFLDKCFCFNMTHEAVFILEIKYIYIIHFISKINTAL